MNKKTTIYLGIVFLALFIILIITRTADRTVERTEYFLDIDTTKVDRIHIVPPENIEVTLNKTGGEWSITEPINFPAEQRYIHEVLKRIADMEIESLVSSREKEQSNYEIDDSSATFVELMQGDRVLAAFYMGKNASTFRHAYFRKSGSKDIYMVKGSYKYHLNRKLSDWRNKIILEIDRDTVEGFNLIYPEQTISVAREDTIWMVRCEKEEFQATLKAVDPLLNYLKTLRCADFFDPESGETPPDFNKPDFSMEVIYDGGRKKSIAMLPLEDGERQWYIKKADDDIVYTVYKGTATLLQKKLDDFRIKQEKEVNKMP